MSSLNKITEVKINKKFLLIAGLVIVIVLAALPSVYFFRKYQKSQEQLEKMAVSPQEEVKSLVEKVGKLMLLPEGEEPTLATVTDIERLSQQPFFARAENGDKVLIYNNAKKAFLYRPSIDKIIEVGPVNISSPSATTTGEAQITTPAPLVSPTPVTIGKVRLLLLNGTATAGLTRTYETEIKEKLPEAEIVDRDNAKKTDYQETLLVDLSGNKTQQANLVASSLGIKVDTLPAGETASPSADFLIIVGADRQ